MQDGPGCNIVTASPFLRNNVSSTLRERRKAPPIPHRVYTEESDQEMDLDWPGHKTVSLTVTPFRKSCSPTDRRYRCIKQQIAD